MSAAVASAAVDALARARRAHRSVDDFLRDLDGIVARLARRLLARCQALTDEICEVEKEIVGRIEALAPSLLKIPGCGTLTAAKILGETVDVTRFRSKAAFARHNGTAPLPVWSGNRARHRLSRTGNRQDRKSVV